MHHSLYSLLSTWVQLNWHKITDLNIRTYVCEVGILASSRLQLMCRLNLCLDMWSGLH